MRSWTPRRPSPRIRARLFPTGSAPEPEVSLVSLWGWLAPAMAVWVLAALVLHKEARGLRVWPTDSATGLVAAVTLHSPQLVAYVASKRHSDRNAWPGACFEWTNEAASRTTAPPSLRTNGLIP